MTAKVILNPYAGRWTALQRREEAAAALEAAGVPFEMVLTTAAGHGIELAAQAVAEGFSPIISAGGDGSISEVVNGMMQAAGDGPLPPFGVLALGSANDLVDNLKLPQDLNAAAQIIAAGQTRNLDLCRVTWGLDADCQVRYFDNNSAMGLEPFITLIQQRIQWLKGDLRYLTATLRGVFAKPRWNVKMEWEGGEYAGPVSLVTVGNNPRTGGLFYVTPHADPFDGRLTFVYGYIPSRLGLLRTLPMILKPAAGNYVEHPAIHEVNSPWLRIHCDEPAPMHADGEIQSTEVHDLEYSVLPGRLPILMG